MPIKPSKKMLPLDRIYKKITESRYEGLVDQIEVLSNMAAERGAISDEQRRQLIDLKRQVSAFGEKGEKWASLADETIGMYSVPKYNGFGETHPVNRMDEMSMNDLFYLHELTHRPEYGIEIDKRIVNKQNGWKQRYPEMFEDEK